MSDFIIDMIELGGYALTLSYNQVSRSLLYPIEYRFHSDTCGLSYKQYGVTLLQCHLVTSAIFHMLVLFRN